MVIDSICASSSIASRIDDEPEVDAVFEDNADFVFRRVSPSDSWLGACVCANETRFTSFGAVGEVGAHVSQRSLCGEACVGVAGDGHRCLTSCVGDGVRTLLAGELVVRADRSEANSNDVRSEPCDPGGDDTSDAGLTCEAGEALDE